MHRSIQIFAYTSRERGDVRNGGSIRFSSKVLRLILIERRDAFDRFEFIVLCETIDILLVERGSWPRVFGVAGTSLAAVSVIFAVVACVSSHLLAFAIYALLPSAIHNNRCSQTKLSKIWSKMGWPLLA